MATLLAFLLMALVSDSQAVPAEWVSHSVTQSSRQGRLCSAFRSAERLLLPTVEARKVKSICQVYAGYQLDFETLKEQQKPNRRSIQGEWKSQNIHLYRNGRDCSDVADAIGDLLNVLPVRKVSASVFCNRGSGSLSYRYEALVPIR